MIPRIGEWEPVMLTFDARFALVSGLVPPPLKEEEFYTNDSLFSINPEATETDTRATLYAVQCVEGPYEGKIGVIDYEKSGKFDKYNVFRSMDDYEKHKGTIAHRTQFVVRQAPGDEFSAMASCLRIVGHFVQLTPEPNVAYEYSPRTKHGYPAWNVIINYEAEQAATEARAQEPKRVVPEKVVEKVADRVKSQMFTPLYKAAAKVASRHKRVMQQKKKTGEKPTIRKDLLGLPTRKCKASDVSVEKTLKVAINKTKYDIKKKRSKK